MKAWHWLLLALLIGPARPSESYRLDSVNTQVSFSVQHLGLQWVSARFSDIAGVFVLDEAGSGKVDVTVGIGSLDCSEPRWNERLRSAEWLDARRFPSMTYHSVEIRFGKRHALASGELTLHGVTRPITLDINLESCTTGVCRFAAHGRIRRSDFGLPHGFWSGGDQVDIAISGAIGARIASARE